MRAIHVAHVVPELVHVAVGAEDGSVGGVEAVVEAIAESQGDVRVIHGWKDRRAAGVAQRRSGTQKWRIGARVVHYRTSLMVAEFYGEGRIDDRLVGVGDRPADLVQTEADEERGFV